VIKNAAKNKLAAFLYDGVIALGDSSVTKVIANICRTVMLNP
jgi:hypothetical protein